MTALVVDDDIMNRELLRRMMNMNGWSVRDVQSGYHAIAECSRNRYDLILVDFFMPGMNGSETAKAIRDVYAIREHKIVIIVVTGSDCLNADDCFFFDAVLVKPFTSDELLASIVKAAKNKR
jgi:CheY-like chemotaxis protein